MLNVVKIIELINVELLKNLTQLLILLGFCLFVFIFFFCKFYLFYFIILFIYNRSISFNPFGSAEPLLSVEIDVRRSLLDLKELIAKLVGHPINTFKIRRAIGVSC